MATGEIAEPTFHWLLKSGYEMVGLVTQPDRPVGRHQELHPPGVKVIAVEAGIPVFQPESLRGEGDLDAIREWNPELIVVMAYGQILPQKLIDLPKMIINLHASLLPRHRGASCLQAAIREGDLDSGWTIMHVIKKLDAGDIIVQDTTPLSTVETGGSLHDRMALSGPGSLEKALGKIERGKADGVPQDDSAVTYAPKLLRADGELNFSLSALELERFIRAYDPWPGTFTVVKAEGKKPRRLRVFPAVKIGNSSGHPGTLQKTDEGELEVLTGEGSLILGEVQLEGGKRISSEDFLRGWRL